VLLREGERGCEERKECKKKGDCDERRERGEGGGLKRGGWGGRGGGLEERRGVTAYKQLCHKPTYIF
jgi:hypothetical protein